MDPILAHVNIRILMQLFWDSLRIFLGFKDSMGPVAIISEFLGIFKDLFKMC